MFRNWIYQICAVTSVMSVTGHSIPHRGGLTGDFNFTRPDSGASWEAWKFVGDDVQTSPPASAPLVYATSSTIFPLSPTTLSFSHTAVDSSTTRTSASPSTVAVLGLSQYPITTSSGLLRETHTTVSVKTEESTATSSSWTTVSHSLTAIAASSTAASPDTTVLKKGLGFTNPNMTKPWVNENVGWAYNWWTGRGDVPPSIEYYPMAWCPTKINVAAWHSAVEQAISTGTKHVLGFNEPDQPGQCDISYDYAAQQHQLYMNPLNGTVKIGSPAVTNNLHPRGVTYLENFLVSCDGQCAIDFLVTHWYGGTDNALWNFHLQVNKTIDLGLKYGIDQVYVTEFGLTGATEEEKAEFVSEVLPWLDANPNVGGYAYFGAFNGSLMLNGEISPVLGAAYAAS